MTTQDQRTHDQPTDDGLRHPDLEPAGSRYDDPQDADPRNDHLESAGRSNDEIEPDAQDRTPGDPTIRDEDATDLGSADTGAGAVTSAGTDSEGRERLVPAERAQSYGTRWDGIKGTFVDEPRQAVEQADALVGELLDDLERVFREQRLAIEQGLDADETSTEDLRLALRRYRSFFDRLLAI